MNHAHSVIMLFAFLTLVHGAEDKVPAQGAEPELITIVRENPGAKLLEKMNRIILPKVYFRKVTLEQALEHLQQQSRELDTSSGPPETKGVKIILRRFPEAPPSHEVISIDLKNVSLIEALRYVTELSQLAFKVEEKEVIVAHPHLYQSRTYARTFTVSPDFLFSDMPKPGVPQRFTDPFASSQPEPKPSNGKIPRQSAQQILERAGINFPEDSSAVFNPATHLLKVTNTLPNLDLVEAFVESEYRHQPLRISTTLTIVEGPGDLIRQSSAAASRTTNMATELTHLMELAKKPDSGVHIIADAILKSASGQKSKSVNQCETLGIEGLDLDSTAKIKALQTPGLTFEVEPILGPDGKTIQTRFAIQMRSRATIPSSEPQVGQEASLPLSVFSSAEFNSSTVSMSGVTKLIGLNKPGANADVLWAAFITSTVHHVEALPRVTKTPVSKSPVPADMVSAILRAPVGLLEFLMEEPQPLREWLEKEQEITFAPGASLERQGEDLHVINSPMMIEAVAALIAHAESVVPNNAVFTLHTIQAPATLLRQLSHQSTAAGADDTAMFTAVEAAVARGEGRFIDSVFFATKSERHSTHESVRELTSPFEFSVSAQGQPAVSFDARKVGSIFAVDPVIGMNGHNVTLKFNHELHPAFPETREVQFIDPGSGQSYHMLSADLHVLKTSGEIAMVKGGTQLIALQQPTGSDTQGQLWATFLKCDVVPQLSKPGEPVRKRSKELPDSELETRTYRVPVDFLSRANEPLAPEPQPPADPFATGTVSDTPSGIRSRSIWDIQNIPFPDGASAAYNPANSTLVVRNTDKNLALVEAMIDRFIRATSTTQSFTVHLFQGPGSMMRRLTTQAGSKSDHRAELDELLAAVKTGQAQALGIAHIENKLGTHSTSQQGPEHTALAKALLTQEGTAGTVTKNRNAGFKFELETTRATNHKLVEVGLASEFHTAACFEHREHILNPQGRRLEFPLTDYHVAKLTTGIVMSDGTAKLLSLYKPTGKPEFEKEDILQAVFITCDLLRVIE